MVKRSNPGGFAFVAAPFVALHLAVSVWFLSGFAARGYWEEAAAREVPRAMIAQARATR